jgi:hypothetical protein
VQFLVHLAAKRILRKHPFHGELDGPLGMLVEEFLKACRLEIAEVPSVMVIELVRHLPPGDANLARIDDHDVITGVHVRCIGGFVLAAQTGRHLRRQTAESLVSRVDNVPITTHRSRIGENGSH